MSEQEEKEALEEKTLINQEEETENELKANHFNETSNDESGREGHDDLPIEQDSQTDNCLSKSKSSSVSSDLNHLGTSASTTTVSMSSYELEINRLRELIATRELDYTELEQKLTEHEQQAKQKIEQLHQEYTQKLQQTLKKIESTQKDKYVMKFVEAEKRCIELNKTIQMCTDKLSDSSKEKQRMNERLEKNKLELNKLKEDNEKKHKEIVTLTKNFENLKKSVCIYEAREKAAELKLKEEVNSHQMTKRSIEQLNAEISEFRLKLNSLNTSSSSGNQTNAEISEGNENQSQSLTPTSLGSVDECVNSEENLKGQTKLGEIHVKTDLTVKAPELKASISPNPQISTDSKLLKFANEEKERMSRELTALKSQLKDMFEERSKLRDRVHHLDQERKLQDISLANFKETLFKQKEMNKELFTEILQLRELQETLIREQEEKAKFQQKITLLSETVNDLRIETGSTQEKCELLVQENAELAEKNQEIVKENAILSEKLENIQVELDKANQLIDQSNTNVKEQIESMKEEINEARKKSESLSSEIQEKIAKIDELERKLVDLQDENASIKKKNVANVKDLTRQIQVLQKKLESGQQTPGPQSTPLTSSFINHSESFINSSSATPTFSLSTSNVHKQMPSSSSSNISSRGIIVSSRKSSTNSQSDKQSLDLNSIGSDFKFAPNDDMFVTPTTANPSRDVVRAYTGTEVVCGGPSAQMNEDVYIVDVDKQKMVEKIVKLQKTLAKRAEKIDFLQDHVNQLTADLKKKTKIIQAYALSEDGGAYTSEAHDEIKDRMSRKQGVMSSLYNNTSKSYTDTQQLLANMNNKSQMTMELCMEINKKLQACLEDTLIKNITLKDSLETLGLEIARLSQENRQLNERLLN